LLLGLGTPFFDFSASIYENLCPIEKTWNRKRTLSCLKGRG
jgi:hypothetical protein